MSRCRRLAIGAAFGVAAAITLAGVSTTAEQNAAPVDVQALYARQVQLGERALQSIEAAPDRVELRDWAGAIIRLRDCRVRLAGSREQKVGACQRAVEQLESLAARAKAQVDAGRAAEWEMAVVAFELNEALIVREQLRRDV